MAPRYHTLDELIAMIDEPNQSACRRILADHETLFRQAAGSSYNHQAWEGGYHDHITEAMNLCVLLHEALHSTGRLAQLEPEEQFTLSDALLVLFWHDIEKPWRFVLESGKPVEKGGHLLTYPYLKDKDDRKRFADEKMREYGIRLTPNLRNGLDYVEGIRDSDYSPFDRRMKPLAALCHMCDTLSARMFYGFPLQQGDGWRATRAAP